MSGDGLEVFPAPVSPGKITLGGNVNGPANANHVDELSGPGAGVYVQLDAGIGLQQIQGGTAAVPANQTPLIFQPRLATDGIARGPWAFFYGSSNFAGVYDQVGQWGYNGLNQVPGQQSAAHVIEATYFTGGRETIESYLALNGPGVTNPVRTWVTIYDTVSGATSISAVWQGVGGSLYFVSQALGGGAITTIAQWNNTGVAFPASYTLGVTTGNLNLSGQAQANLTCTGGDIVLRANTAGHQIGYQADVHQIQGVSSSLSTFQDYRYGAGTFALYPNDRAFDLGVDPLSNPTINSDLRWKSVRAVNGLFGLATGVGISVGGGIGVVGVANAGTTPNANPVGGFVTYGSAGAQVNRGSGGTITTVSPA